MWRANDMLSRPAGRPVLREATAPVRPSSTSNQKQNEDSLYERAGFPPFNPCLNGPRTLRVPDHPAQPECKQPGAGNCFRPSTRRKRHSLRPLRFDSALPSRHQVANRHRPRLRLLCRQTHQDRPKGQPPSSAVPQLFARTERRTRDL